MYATARPGSPASVSSTTWTEKVERVVKPLSQKESPPLLRAGWDGSEPLRREPGL